MSSFLIVKQKFFFFLTVFLLKSLGGNTGEVARNLLLFFLAF